MLSTWMFVAVAAALTSDAQPADNWHADYGVALAETQKDSQPLLVVLDVPGDKAKQLDPTLLTAEGGAFPLDKYSLCHIDVTTEYGKKVAEGFKVTEFPHVAIIDNSGSVVLRRVKGNVTKKDWLAVLNKHSDGQRANQVRHVVAKPVVSEAQPVVTSQPVVSTPSSFVPSQPMIQYPTAQPAARPYCPSCQLRNR